MAVLLEDTKKKTAYLRRHVKVVEMWEWEWKEVRNESDVKTFLPPSSRPRWIMTQHQILAAVVDGTLFGMVECDVRVPEELQDYFSEMQPVFKNASVTRDDIGPFMRQYAEEHDILSKPRVMLVGSFRGVKILLATPLLRWYLAHGLVVDRVYQIIEYEPNPCFRQFGESVSAARLAGDRGKSLGQRIRMIIPRRRLAWDTVWLLCRLKLRWLSIATPRSLSVISSLMSSVVLSLCLIV